MLDLQHELY